MKTLIQKLAETAPNIALETIWSHDPDLRDIRKDCDGFDDADPDDWQAWQSEVQASVEILDGQTLTGSDYLGGTWEKACDHPSKSNPDISGYLPQMIDEALQSLIILVSTKPVSARSIELSREIGRAIDLVRIEMRERHQAQQAA